MSIPAAAFNSFRFGQLRGLEQHLFSFLGRWSWWERVGRLWAWFSGPPMDDPCKLFTQTVVVLFILYF